MSAAISHLLEGRIAAPALPHWRGIARRVQSPLRRMGSCTVAALTLAALLLWGFTGSLAMGLRTPPTAEPRLALLWLAIALGIAVAGLAAGLLARASLGE